MNKEKSNAIMSIIKKGLYDPDLYINSVVYDGYNDLFPYSFTKGREPAHLESSVPYIISINMTDTEIQSRLPHISYRDEIPCYRIYLYFEDYSEISFKIEENYHDSREIALCALCEMLCKLEIEGCLVVGLDALKSINIVIQEDLKQYFDYIRRFIPDILTEYDAETVLSVLARYQFFSFDDLIKTLQGKEMYDILAEVLEAGNKLGFVGKDEEELL